jgi:hypothetical protein
MNDDFFSVADFASSSNSANVNRTLEMYGDSFSIQ